MRGRKHPKDLLTRMISLRIPEHHYQAALKAAEAEGRSFSSWVRTAISFALSDRRRLSRVPPIYWGITSNSAASSTPTRIARCPHQMISGVGITSMNCWSCGTVLAVAA